jgi:hypothetical protein
MIARQRGEHTAHLRWRPQRPTPLDDTPCRHELAEPDIQSDESLLDDLAELEPVEYGEDLNDQPIVSEPAVRRPRVWPRLLVLLALALAALAVGNRSGSPAPPNATPSGWLSAYMTSSVRTPQEVCAHLLTPALERLFAQANGSCPGAYRNVKSSPYHVLRILQTGDTAAIELHWLPNVGYSTIVLNRQDGRWRAVDMIPGGHVVPHQS